MGFGEGAIIACGSFSHNTRGLMALDGQVKQRDEGGPGASEETVPMSGVKWTPCPPRQSCALAEHLCLFLFSRSFHSAT